ncbi:nicotinamide riboside transporter PnuC [Psychrosphaera sp. B3R10]|uniref:nicotinamide riboside transporter PnuC n=1 Tax=unclassified Psychrosphaera TaxID=2641570 RepID=UPI001C0A346A|nr:MULTISPECIES: nicotinamide riboside transporter PnuC [unclassified Psychrosphaera]MBU2883410.1 nicotinamide riboside transporter PnuC [Psychrosphaera sp. I2R16]MBU2990496.1 nicotinamide riboside transporter PnuC [Psychrosphaera sp. B3R10]
MIDGVLAGFEAMSIWEYIAAILSLVYVILAIKQNSWCWPAAFVSTAIYTLLFWHGALLMESLLNFYYMLMAVFGFHQWRTVDKCAEENAIFEDITTVKPIISWRMASHIKYIAVISLMVLVVGFMLDNFTHANMAYLDTFTTVFALFATYLLTQKVLENWLYWVVIDIASLFLYVTQGYYPTVVLFMLYTLFAAHGYISWRKLYIEEQETDDNELLDHA